MLTTSCWAPGHLQPGRCTLVEGQATCYPSRSGSINFRLSMLLRLRNQRDESERRDRGMEVGQIVASCQGCKWYNKLTLICQFSLLLLVLFAAATCTNLCMLSIRANKYHLYWMGWDRLCDELLAGPEIYLLIKPSLSRTIGKRELVVHAKI